MTTTLWKTNTAGGGGCSATPVYSKHWHKEGLWQAGSADPLSSMTFFKQARTRWPILQMFGFQIGSYKRKATRGAIDNPPSLGSGGTLWRKMEIQANQCTELYHSTSITCLNVTLTEGTLQGTAQESFILSSLGQIGIHLKNSSMNCTYSEQFS